MRALALLYHDVVPPGDWDASGFPGAGAASYKLERAEFERHLAAVSAVATCRGTVDGLQAAARGGGPLPVLLTFDDGGASAYSCVADLLEAAGWHGHFFITTGYLDAPHFVTRAQVRDLAARGHMIGTHSSSHPIPMARLSRRRLLTEWASSVHALQDLLGEPVRLGSVPGGGLSRQVVEAAAAAGMTALFTSEPTTHCRVVDGCVVIGRYALRRGMPAAAAAALASGALGARLRQACVWNLKKVAKVLGGSAYLALRDAVYARARA